MNEEVKAVIFDIGGVLAIRKTSKLKKNEFPFFGVHMEVCKKLKISPDQYIDAIDINYSLSVEGKVSKKEIIKSLSENLGVSQNEIKKIYSDAFKKVFMQNEELFNEAMKLKKIGYGISILSDQWPLSKDELIPKKFYKIFSPVVVSCDVKTRKPRREVYEMTLKKLKLKPSQTLFIDNQTWNTKAAEKIGMKTILFKNNKQLFEDKIWKSLF